MDGFLGHIFWSNTSGLIRIIIVTFAVSSMFTACKEVPKVDANSTVPLVSIDLDLDRIRKSGKLILLTENTSTSYYLYRGQVIGYDYELVKSFCESQNIELETKVIGDLNKMFQMLLSGEGDIIACNLAITADRLQKVSFTVPLAETAQVLVQRKPKEWRKMRKRKWQDSLVRNNFELMGKMIHVHEYSSFYNRLLNIQEEIGGEMDIQLASGEIDSEQLIRMVAAGEIDYTVADENVALLNKTYYQILNVDCKISFPQKIAWAVRPNADSLLRALNSWIVDKSNAKRIAYTYNKFFKSTKLQKKRVQSEFSSFSGKRISPFDEAFKVESEKIGWDWRLLAALVYQESRFDPHAKSWAGAFGLMQLMPATAKRFGVDSAMSAKKNIVAGTRFLKYLDHFWEDRVPNEKERYKFVLASYNCGHGHVLDAVALAKELNLDSARWESHVEEALRLIQNPKYYSMDVVKYGYCRGGDASDYVQNIMTQYQHYLSLKL